MLSSVLSGDGLPVSEQPANDMQGATSDQCAEAHAAAALIEEEPLGTTQKEATIHTPPDAGGGDDPAPDLNADVVQCGVSGPVAAAPNAAAEGTAHDEDEAALCTPFGADGGDKPAQKMDCDVVQCEPCQTYSEAPVVSPQVPVQSPEMTPEEATPNTPAGADGIEDPARGMDLVGAQCESSHVPAEVHATAMQASELHPRTTQEESQKSQSHDAKLNGCASDDDSMALDIEDAEDSEEDGTYEPESDGDSGAAAPSQNGAPGLTLWTEDYLDRNPVHRALLQGESEQLRTLLAQPDADAVTRAVVTPYRGLPTLHLALATPAAVSCLEQLMVRPDVEIDCRDEGGGRTALHLACQQGNAEVCEWLLNKGADPSLQDKAGNLALHYAVSSHCLPCTRTILQRSESSWFAGRQHPLFRCINRQAWQAALLIYKNGWPIAEDDITDLRDYATELGLATEWEFITSEGSNKEVPFEAVCWPEGSFPRSGSTALVTDAGCLQHGALPTEEENPRLRHKLISETPENPHRLEVICGKFGALRSQAFADLKWVTEPPPAPLVDLLRVHEYWYIKKLQDAVEYLRRENKRCGVLDRSDTVVTVESWSAARRACGCVLEAVDLVCTSEARNAFCAVRPPGHHLGPAGACNNKDLEDEPEGSQGFCLLNNVAVGAAYARCVYRKSIKKVAIIDFDVHHGNGTEAIVRNVIGKRGRKLNSRSFAGGFEVEFDAQTPPTCKPWLDPESDRESIYFASIHGYGNGFYPNTGPDCLVTSPTIVNVTLKEGASSSQFREKLRAKILPEMLQFKPDIIFVSAGFDAHGEDLIGNCNLVHDDFVWVTQQLMAIANRCCKGRLVSVLEGGYNTRAEALSPFAECVAAHVSALLHTSSRFSGLDSTTHGIKRESCPTRAQEEPPAKRLHTETGPEMCEAIMEDVVRPKKEADDECAPAERNAGDTHE